MLRHGAQERGLGLHTTVTNALLDLLLHGGVDGRRVDAVMRRSLGIRRLLDGDGQGSGLAGEEADLAAWLQPAPAIVFPPPSPACTPAAELSAARGGITTAQRLAWHRDPDALHAALTDAFTCLPSAGAAGGGRGGAASPPRPWLDLAPHLTTYGAGYAAYVCVTGLSGRGGGGGLCA
jgi:hypothetical protein